MSNTPVAELITVSITGTPVRAEIAEILDYRTDFFGGRGVDVRLVDGTVARHVDALDIEVGVAARTARAAA
ncbi:hypothetical protein ACWEQV_25760 [Rhodococcus aetherivorans]|uniref:hypothetical protein n=1 Tax=Rhodococcus aetherivorans TaxID=191292 RepID=UPI0026F29461|nr:hypothetical protein [Rhodococcus aetherivorans]WKX01997.1 hypothetical protein Q3O43_29415 [Rhodococcus aetherivorans]